MRSDVKVQGPCLTKQLTGNQLYRQSPSEDKRSQFHLPRILIEDAKQPIGLRETEQEKKGEKTKKGENKMEG